MKQKLGRTIIGAIAVFICGAGLAKASLIATEDFSYSGSSLTGQNGGTGWSNAWSASAYTLSSNGTSLAFTGITPVGGWVSNISTGTTYRGLSTPIDLSAAGTYYLSMLVTKSDVASFDVAFSDGTTDRWRMRWNAAEVLSCGVGTSTNASAGTYSYANTLLVVMKMVSATGTVADAVSLSVFQTGDTISEPVTWAAVNSLSTSVVLNRLKISGSVAGGQIDAIRIGTTFADVAAIPEPVTAGMLGIGAVILAVFRRRIHNR